MSVCGSTQREGIRGQINMEIDWEDYFIVEM